MFVVQIIGYKDARQNDVSFVINSIKKNHLDQYGNIKI